MFGGSMADEIHSPELMGCWGCEECMPGCEHGRDTVGWECICSCNGCQTGQCLRSSFRRNGD